MKESLRKTAIIVAGLCLLPLIAVSAQSRPAAPWEPARVGMPIRPMAVQPSPIPTTFPPCTAPIQFSGEDNEGRIVVLVDLGGAMNVDPNVDLVRQCFFNLPAGYRITRIWTFVGMDRGNLQENLIEVADIQQPTPFHLYQRSLHHEALGIYESWDHLDLNYAMPPLPAQDTMFSVFMLARSTNGMPGHVQWGLRISLDPIPNPIPFPGQRPQR